MRNTIRKALSIMSLAMALWISLCGLLFENDLAMMLGALYAGFWLAAQLDMGGKKRRRASHGALGKVFK